MRGNSILKQIKQSKYWIATVAYIIIFSLSILCLVAYVPDLEEGKTLTMVFLIACLVLGTLSFVWEAMQWRKGRTPREQTDLEKIVRQIENEANRK